MSSFVKFTSTMLYKNVPTVVHNISSIDFDLDYSSVRGSTDADEDNIKVLIESN